MAEEKGLKEIRTKLGLSRRRIAELAGISEQSVQRYEHKLTHPGVHVRRALERITRILRKEDEDD